MARRDPSVPECEQLPLGDALSLIRRRYRRQMLAAMKDDPAWSLRLAQIASLDANPR